MKTLAPQIRLDSSQFEMLSEESKKRQMSIDEFVSNLVKQFLDEHTISDKHQSANFMSIVGLGDSGATDVSEHHDKYLGEVIANEHLR